VSAHSNKLLNNLLMSAVNLHHRSKAIIQML